MSFQNPETFFGTQINISLKKSMSSLTIHIHRIFYISEKGTKRLSKKFHVTSTNHMKLQEQFRTPKKGKNHFCLARLLQTIQLICYYSATHLLLPVVNAHWDLT